LPAGTIVLLQQGTAPPSGWTFIGQMTQTFQLPKPAKKTEMMLDAYVKN
jgi:hypothetical protein